MLISPILVSGFNSGNKHHKHSHSLKFYSDEDDCGGDYDDKAGSEFFLYNNLEMNL
ncbi:MAG: hypothetical protein ACI81S_001894 [Sphingobacteriales bacterium]|jgi:hypothetical protein